MRPFTIHQAFLLFTWKFPGVLATVPTPGFGGESFRTLRDELSKFDFDADSYNIDAGKGNSLSDLKVHMRLLDRFGVTIGYSDFQLSVSDLTQEDIPNVQAITEALFKVVKTIDPEFTQGHSVVKVGIHITIDDFDATSFLSTHLNPATNVSGWYSRGMLYARDAAGVVGSMSVVVTKSVIVKNGLYMEVFSEQDGDADTLKITKKFDVDFAEALSVLGLQAPPQEKVIA